MDNFDVVLSPHATKDLDGFSDAVCGRIARALNALRENPFPRGKLIKKIKGKDADFYRLRSDKHRVFYVIEAGRVVVLRIVNKKEAGRLIRSLD
ncbi:MAG: type II toxin-antitoxin system RelE/ParE family toxin [Nitrospiraceae bacterium]|nr:type II toxin-antitoxin system RelE/ParE family toxin [Nitrospiraceae bacterium]